MKENIHGTCRAFYVGMAASVLAVIGFANAGKTAATSEAFNLIDGLQRQMAKAWSSDVGLVYDISTNITSAIKSMQDVSVRQDAVSRYVDFLLTLDLRVNINKVGPVIVRRHLFANALEQLDDSGDSAVMSWNLRLKYHRQLQVEREWFEKAAGTNWMAHGGVTFVRLQPSNSESELKQYRRKRDETLTSRRTSLTLKRYADFLADEIRRDELSYDSDEFVRAVERMAPKQRESLLSDVCRTLGRNPNVKNMLPGGAGGGVFFDGNVDRK